jgi:3-deoxy-D-manno-octulosonic-acid transferase
VYLLYSLLLTLGLIILLPRFVVDAFRNGKYVTGLRQRLGTLPEINPDGRPLIWLHCVSVGETQAAQTLVEALRRNFPKYPLAISTTTVTGQNVAQKLFADKATVVFYFPIDFGWIIRRVLNRLKPAAILIVETELWPQLFREAGRRDTKVVIVNGRISDKSFKRYLRIRRFMRRVLRDITIGVMQTEKDAQRIRELGLDAERIEISGNVKFDSGAIDINQAVTNEIRDRFGLSADRPLIVAASTHGGEEAMMLQAFKYIAQTIPNAHLMLVPRHPERFAEVASLLESSGLTFARRSSPPSTDDASARVILLDTIGELREVFPLAAIVFVGGSLVPHGGHSVIEPAQFGVCTVTGPHTQNFAAVVKTMRDADALVQLSPNADAPELGSALLELLEDESRRRAIGERAKAVCENNRGATEKTIGVLAEVLSGVQPAHVLPSTLPIRSA